VATDACVDAVLSTWCGSSFWDKLIVEQKFENLLIVEQKFENLLIVEQKFENTPLFVGLF